MKNANRISLRGAFKIDAKNDNLIIEYKNGTKIKIPTALLRAGK